MGKGRRMDKGWRVVSLEWPRIRKELGLDASWSGWAWLLRRGAWAVAVLQHRHTGEHGWALLWRGEGERPVVPGPYHATGCGRRDSREARAQAQRRLYEVAALAIPQHANCRCAVEG